MSDNHVGAQTPRKPRYVVATLAAIVSILSLWIGGTYAHYTGIRMFTLVELGGLAMATVYGYIGVWLYSRAKLVFTTGVKTMLWTFGIMVTFLVAFILVFVAT